uniref:Uncharacterized protein n=1 Tax=Clonostachys compactiuscula TaxID=122660 RepID=A0A8F1Y2F6_9HYPO|nr:hypothetical protein [Clonostachys compactiuscula]
MFFICIQVPFIHNFFKVFFEYIFFSIQEKNLHYLGIPLLASYEKTNLSLSIIKETNFNITSINLDNLSEISQNNKEINKEIVYASNTPVHGSATGIFEDIIPTDTSGIIPDIKVENDLYSLRENMNIDPIVLNPSYSLYKNTVFTILNQYEKASNYINRDISIWKNDPVFDHPIKETYPKSMSLPIDHVMNMDLDSNWFKNPKLMIKLSYFGNIDIAHYNPIAFWPGCVNNDFFQGSFYPTMPLLTLKAEFRSSDQLNYAMTYYAHVDILNKEKILLNNKYLAMNYDRFYDHFIEIRDEINKRQSILSKFTNIQFQEELKSLSKIEQDRKMAEIWYYYATDRIWEELRREHGEKLYSNYTYFQSDPNHKWVYKDKLDKTWENYRALGMCNDRNFEVYPMFWYTWKDPSKLK